MKAELAVMRLLFEYLRSDAGLQRRSSEDGVSAADTLLQNYKDYVRKDRGLTVNSILFYAPFIRGFLAAQTTQAGRVSPELFDTSIVRTSFLSTPSIGPVSIPAVMHGTPVVFPFPPPMRPSLARPL